VYCFYSDVLYVNFFLIFISSPFLFVIDDDRMIRYTGADDATGDAADA